MKIKSSFKPLSRFYALIALLFIFTVIPFVLSGCTTDPVQAFLQAMSNYESTAPTITSITPSSGPAYGGYQATITGTGFLIAKSISFGGLTLKPNSDFTVVNDTTISVTIPEGPQNAGTVNVAVTSNAGLTSLQSQFTYDTTGEVWSLHFGWGMPPTVTSVTPSWGLVTGGTVVTVSGTGFLFGGESLPVSLWQPPTPTEYPYGYPNSFIQVSPSPDKNWGVRFTQPQSFTMTMPADYGRFMEWNVRVYNAWGYSNISPADVFLQEYQCMQTAPTNLQGSETISGALSLSFKGVLCQDGDGASIVSNYILRYSADKNFRKGVHTITKNVLAFGTTVPSSALSPGTTYYWQIQAVFQEPNPSPGEGPVYGPWASGPPVTVIVPPTCSPKLVKPWAMWEAQSNGTAAPPALLSIQTTLAPQMPIETPHPVTCTDNNPNASAVQWNWGDRWGTHGTPGGKVKHVYFNTSNIQPMTGVMDETYPISETVTLRNGSKTTLSQNIEVATAHKIISPISWITEVWNGVRYVPAPGINPTPQDGVLISFTIANIGRTQSSKPGKITIRVAGTKVFTYYPAYDGAKSIGGTPSPSCLLPNQTKFPESFMEYSFTTQGNTGVPESIYCPLNQGLMPGEIVPVAFPLVPGDFPNGAYPAAWLSPSGLDNGLSVVNDISVEYGSCHYSCGLFPVPPGSGPYYSSAAYAPAAAGFSFDIVPPK